MKLAIFLLAAFTGPFAFADEAVLFIGDSHSVMSFGQILAERLGPSIKRYAVSSTTAYDWQKPYLCPRRKTCEFTYGFSTPDGNFTGPVPPAFGGVDLLLQQTAASQIIIALGTNDANQRCRFSSNAQMRPIKSLLRRIGSRACFWIGPPTYKQGPVYNSCGLDYDVFVLRLKSVVQAHGCRFIDSRQILDPQTGQAIEADLEDQLHFDSRLGEIWGAAAAEQIHLLPSGSKTAAF